jgi:hypothetical protein
MARDAGVLEAVQADVNLNARSLDVLRRSLTLSQSLNQHLSFQV